MCLSYKLLSLHYIFITCGHHTNWASEKGRFPSCGGIFRLGVAYMPDGDSAPAGHKRYFHLAFKLNERSWPWLMHPLITYSSKSHPFFQLCHRRKKAPNTVKLIDRNRTCLFFNTFNTVAHRHLFLWLTINVCILVSVWLWGVKL